MAVNSRIIGLIFTLMVTLVSSNNQYEEFDETYCRWADPSSQTADYTVYTDPYEAKDACDKDDKCIGFYSRCGESLFYSCEDGMHMADSNLDYDGCRSILFRRPLEGLRLGYNYVDVDWIEDVDCGGDVIQSNFLTLDSAVQACYADSRCNCVQTDNSPEVSYWTRTGDSRNRRSGFISWVARDYPIEFV